MRRKLLSLLLIFIFCLVACDGAIEEDDSDFADLDEPIAEEQDDEQDEFDNEAEELGAELDDEAEELGDEFDGEAEELGDEQDDEAEELGDELDAVTNGKLTLDLQFIDPVQLPDGQTTDWTPALKQPYINAANKWLSALVGIEGRDTHTIVIDITVKSLPPDVGGEAAPTEDEEIGQYVFPVAGEIIIASNTYEAGFDPVEFDANLVHEMGHVIGLGTITEDYTTHDPATNGFVFRGIETNRGVELYNEIYGTAVDFVPISDDKGHLYDFVLQGDEPRELSDGSTLPPMTEEVMANGQLFWTVALGVLDDIGYIVDYSDAEIYLP